jgi:glucosamine-6-phosphate deaminase
LQINIFTTKAELGQAVARDAAVIINHAIAERYSAYVIAATGASQFEFLDALTLEPIDWPKME